MGEKGDYIFGIFVDKNGDFWRIKRNGPESKVAHHGELRNGKNISEIQGPKKRSRTTARGPAKQVCPTYMGGSVSLKFSLFVLPWSKRLLSPVFRIVGFSSVIRGCGLSVWFTRRAI